MIDWAVGLSTGCFYQTSIFDCLETILHAGFDRIEVCSSPRHLDYHDHAAVKKAARLIDELGMEPFSFHAPFAQHIDITSFDPQIRDHSRNEILKAAEASALLGVQYYVIHPGPERGGLPEDQRLQRLNNALAVLTETSRRCRELGVTLLLENMLPHLFAGQTQDLLWILGALDDTDIGVCLDTGHAHLASDLESVVQKLSTHLLLVHASDNRGRFDDHLPPGDGNINWKLLLRQLLSSDFQGTFILEIMGVEDEHETLQRAQRGRHHLRTLSRQMHRENP